MNRSSPGTAPSNLHETTPWLSCLRWVTSPCLSFPPCCHPELVPGNHSMFAGFGEDEKKRGEGHRDGTD